MPTFTKRVRISNLAGSWSVEALAVVDTGATFCHISQEMTAELLLTPRPPRRFRLANGRVVEYRIADAVVELLDHGESVATSLAIGERGAAVLLGGMALDAFGLGVDA